LNRRIVVAVIFLLGAGLRAVDVRRPADGRMHDIWRECDMSAIARNFDREGMNLFYPRIDWRGTGPGYVEMELPVLSFAMASVYRVIGIHEVVGRLIEYALSLVALSVELALLAYLLPPLGAAAGGVFFALSPLPIRVATSLQPEGLMLTGYLVAGFAFIRWLDTDRPRDYLVALAATALAILAKSPATHIGVFFLILLLARRGLAVFGDWRIWAFAAGALAPGVLWYMHAHSLYTTYGNSLGVSNEPHWIHQTFFTEPRHVRDLVGLDLTYVWGYAGAAVAAAGVALAPRPRAVTVGLAWLASVATYYVLAEHTLSSPYAVYYHVVMAPCAALLFGAGAQAFAERGHAHHLWYAALALPPLAYAGRIVQDVKDARPRDVVSAYACAQTLAPHVAPGALMLVSGGNCTNDEGEPVPFNASHMLYWMDRKGFDICREGKNADSVAAYVARGAQYFAADRSMLDVNPGMEAELRRRYPVAAECPIVLLFDLRSRR
jgi:Dolichyl-phosphate-mannose-protein mannosyltransferase